MTKNFDVGQRLVVGFLIFCSGTGFFNLLYGLTRGTKLAVIFGLAQLVFATVTGLTAWKIYYWKKDGWYLGWFVILQWVSALVNFRGGLGWFTWVASLGIIGMALWLRLPDVKAKFEIKKAFG